LSQYRIFSKPRQKPMRPGRFRWLGIGSLWFYRVLTWGVLAIGLAFAGTVLALRYWVFPNIDSYREDIARVISERTGQKVTIGGIHAQWEGLRPQLVLERVMVHDTAGRPALELSRIDNTLSWMSVPTLQLRTHALDIYRPRLSIRRDARDVVSIAGIEVTGEGGSNTFVDSLLRQREIEVHDATIVWNDELRKAPQLELTNVQLHLVNSGGRHRFGLRATPPKELAAPLDVRGDLRGGTIAALADWNGKLFIELDYADIAAWRTWVPFPIEFPRGAGAMRAWFTFSRDRLVEVVADVRLAAARSVAPLRAARMEAIRGRVRDLHFETWSHHDRRSEAPARGLSAAGQYNRRAQAARRRAAGERDRACAAGCARGAPAVRAGDAQAARRVLAQGETERGGLALERGMERAEAIQRAGTVPGPRAESRGKDAGICRRERHSGGERAGRSAVPELAESDRADAARVPRRARVRGAVGADLVGENRRGDRAVDQ
jgi:hypothetical protein